MYVKGEVKLPSLIPFSLFTATNNIIYICIQPFDSGDLLLHFVLYKLSDTDETIQS